MRIISKFRDYYDSIQKHTPDDPDIWIRKEASYKEVTSPLSYREDRNSIYYYEFVVYFCGKPYYGLKLRTPYLSAQMPNDEAFCYTIEDVTNFIKGLKDKKLRNKYSKIRPPRWGSPSVFTATGFARHQDEILKYDPLELHRKYNSPIILELSRYGRHIIYGLEEYANSYDHRKNLIVNPQLSRINFEKVKDPYTAFNDIDRYLSSILGTQQPEMIQISDKDQAAKKGFDKWSFKKMPTKKK